MCVVLPEAIGRLNRCDECGSRRLDEGAESPSVATAEPAIGDVKAMTATLPRTVAAIQILQVGEPPCGDSGNTVRKLRHCRGDSNAAGLRHCREESEDLKKSRAEALPYRTSEKPSGATSCSPPASPNNEAQGKFLRFCSLRRPNWACASTLTAAHALIHRFFMSRTLFFVRMRIFTGPGSRIPIPDSILYNSYILSERHS